MIIVRCRGIRNAADVVWNSNRPLARLLSKAACGATSCCRVRFLHRWLPRPPHPDLSMQTTPTDRTRPRPAPAAPTVGRQTDGRCRPPATMGLDSDGARVSERRRQKMETGSINSNKSRTRRNEIRPAAAELSIH